MKFSKQFAVCKFKQVDSRDLKLLVITEFDVLIVKCQLFMTIDPEVCRVSREDNYHLSSVTVITSLIANFIHGRSVTRRKHFALR